jgi:hypothetical protein
LRTEPLRAMVIGAFVRGLSMRDVESLCEKAGLGKLSKSTASRICEELRERFEAFKRRDRYEVHLTIVEPRHLLSASGLLLHECERVSGRHGGASAHGSETPAYSAHCGNLGASPLERSCSADPVVCSAVARTIAPRVRLSNQRVCRYFLKCARRESNPRPAA